MYGWSKRHPRRNFLLYISSSLRLLYALVLKLRKTTLILSCACIGNKLLAARP